MTLSRPIISIRSMSGQIQSDHVLPRYAPRLGQRIAFVSGSIVLLGGVLTGPALAGAERVAAQYAITFGGIEVGKFQFNSTIDGSKYELNSRSRVKLLFGAFKWGSGSATKGHIGSTIQPETFKLSYQIKKKNKSGFVRFKDRNVVAVENTPQVRYGSKHVPLQPKHLIGVVDPMTAIMQMTQGARGNPCRHSADIFDGKRRLRLSLSSKGKQVIDERRSGQPRYGYVCRIQFTPIAGHKKTDQLDYLKKNKNIEIVLRPVPSADIVVPYQVRVPTMFGTVAITARAVSIVNESDQRIAMRY